MTILDLSSKTALFFILPMIGVIIVFSMRIIRCFPDIQHALYRIQRQSVILSKRLSSSRSVPSPSLGSLLTQRIMDTLFSNIIQPRALRILRKGSRKR